MTVIWCCWTVLLICVSITHHPYSRRTDASLLPNAVIYYLTGYVCVEWINATFSTTLSSLRIEFLQMTKRNFCPVDVKNVLVMDEWFLCTVYLTEKQAEKWSVDSVIDRLIGSGVYSCRGQPSSSQWAPDGGAGVDSSAWQIQDKAALLLTLPVVVVAFCLFSLYFSHSLFLLPCLSLAFSQDGQNDDKSFHPSGFFCTAALYSERVIWTIMDAMGSGYLIWIKQSWNKTYNHVFGFFLIKVRNPP